MANRKATFAKRQRETDLKDRAKAKEDRRTQKRTEVRDTKGPQIAWEEAVHAVTSDELPSLEVANQAGTDDEAEPTAHQPPPLNSAAAAPVPAAAAPAVVASPPPIISPSPAPSPASPRRAS